MNTPPSPAQAAQRIAALEAELAAARAETQALTATVSHDLRAPLRHITSFAKLLEEDAGAQLSGDARDFLDHMTTASRQLAQMLDALLALSRVGTAPLHLQPVALDEIWATLVQQRVNDLHVREPQRVVRCTLAPGLPAVHADAGLLTAALGHVLDNALKFTARRAETLIDIEAHLDAATRTVRCTVADNGAGFAPEGARQLFGPFKRLHSSSQFAGLGMGLALAHKSLQRMGAEIAISATPEAGCRVTVVLPSTASSD